MTNPQNPSKLIYGTVVSVAQKQLEDMGKRATIPGMPRFVSLTRTGIELPKDLSLEQWSEIGRVLTGAQSSLHWWWGDWWAYGEHRYGERQAIVDSDDWAGPSFQSLADKAWVCRQFKTSRRREVLSFSHHREVASMTSEEGDRWLDWCLETISETNKPQSTRALRNAINDQYIEAEPPSEPPAVPETKAEPKDAREVLSDQPTKREQEQWKREREEVTAGIRANAEQATTLIADRLSEDDFKDDFKRLGDLLKGAMFDFYGFFGEALLIEMQKRGVFPLDN
jgi:hypothetical protein